MAQYVITDGKQYICRNYNNKYVITYNACLAEVFPTKILAEKIYNNSLPKALRKSVSVQEYDSFSDNKIAEHKPLNEQINEAKDIKVSNIPDETDLEKITLKL